MDVTLQALYDQPLFDVLPDEILVEILPLFEVRYFDKGDTVFRQGEEARHFYLISSGEFEVVVVEEGEEHRINLLYPGEFFGDIALLYDEPRGATVRAMDDSEVLVLAKEDFLELLERYPPLRRRLHAEGRQIEKRTNLTFPGQAEDEIVIYLNRRHWIALLKKMGLKVILPLVLWFVAMVIAYLAVRGDTDTEATVALIGLLFLAIPGAFALWETVDWYNDYFIVTNERVIHIEKVLFFSQQRYEASLNKIQNVNVVHHTPLSEALQYGDMIIATAAQGGAGATLILDHMPQASIVAARIIQEVNQARNLQQQEGKEQKRRALRAALGIEPDTGPAPDEAESSELPAAAGPPPSAIGVMARSLVNYLKPTMREQRGSTILWRKHWLKLLQVSLVPWLLFLATFAFVVAELWFLDLTDIGSRVLVGIGLLVQLVMAGWLWWLYEDWRNDLYILTPETLIDQEQKPFGFDKSVRRAALDMVQDTRYVQPNPLMVWFNVGNVLIQTAGAEGLFTFDWVKNPRAVQNEIFRYIQARQELRQRNEAAAISQELLELLKMYDEERDNARPYTTEVPPAPPGEPGESDPDATTRRWPF